MARQRPERLADGRVQAGVERFGMAGERGNGTLRGQFQAPAHLLPMVRQRAKSLGARRGEPLMQRSGLAGERGNRGPRGRFQTSRICSE